MRRAHAARLLESFPQRRSRPVPPHLEVVRRDAEAFRHRVRVLLAKVDRPEHLCVLRLQRGQQFEEAGAQRSVCRPVQLFGQIDIPEWDAAAPLHVPASVCVDDGVSEDAVEPGANAFLVPQRFGGLHRPQQRVLQHVFGEMGVADPRTDEPQELLTRRREAFFDIGAPVCRA